MEPSRDILELARKARSSGFFSRLAPPGEHSVGLALPGAILARGKDAVSFLHSQVTNDVEGLAPGEGNFSARVTRTGQLVEFFSLHRLPDQDDLQSVLLLLERDAIPALIQDFDAFLFSDDVSLSDISHDYCWLAVQGPGALQVCGTTFGEAADAWGALDAYAVRPLPDPAPSGSLLFRRSLSGDSGFVLALSGSDGSQTDASIAALSRAATDAGLIEVDEPALSRLIEVLRIEAGQVRVGPDTRGRKSILPETGLEQHAVSYTKGCYLGQEVIARVRTYGSLPYGLRGLVFDSPGDWESQSEFLAGLPDSGSDLLTVDGSKLGQIVSRTLSPALEAPIAFAYLDKKHRTPGSRLTLRTGTGDVEAEVVLLPFYNAPDRDARVASLYDRAIRIFANGREQEALEILEQALHLDPTFSDAYEAIGVILGRAERFHEAIDIFKRLEELAPHEAMVNTNLSLYYMKIGDKLAAEDEAARAMQKSLTSGSETPERAQRLEAEMEAQRIADAQRKKSMFSQVLEIDSQDGVALFGLGNALSILDEWEEAERCYARACETDPDNSAVYLARGKALEQLGREAEAEGVLRAGMEVASRKGDLMPLKEMEHRVLLLSGARDRDGEERDE